MSLINNSIFLRFLFLFIVVTFCSKCSFLNALPNPYRDKWYTEHTEDFNKFHEEAIQLLNKVNIGLTKEQVLVAWGEPWKRKTGDLWYYKFPKYFPNSIKVQFEDGVVVEKW